MGDAAATGFFPGQLLIEEQDFLPTRRQESAGKSPGRTSSHDCDRILRFLLQPDLDPFRVFGF
jgi:hypothetical protein